MTEPGRFRAVDADRAFDPVPVRVGGAMDDDVVALFLDFPTVPAAGHGDASRRVWRWKLIGGHVESISI